MFYLLSAEEMSPSNGLFWAGSVVLHCFDALVTLNVDVGRNAKVGVDAMKSSGHTAKRDLHPPNGSQKPPQPDSGHSYAQSDKYVGRRSVLNLLTETWDKLIASDPGLTRLMMAGSAAIGVASTLGVEYEFSNLMHAGAKGTLVFMLFGAIVAMIGMMALSGTGFWSKIRTAAFFPVAIGIGLFAGTLVGGHTDIMLAVFVVIMYVAVAVRRFGIPYFFYGFMGFIGYFFASFMGAKVSALPAMILAVIVGTIWVIILSTTVLRTSPARALERTMTAFDARGRAVFWAGATLLRDGGQRERASRRLRARQIQLSEAALMVEGWSAEPGALSHRNVAPALRRRLVDIQQVLDRLSECAETLKHSESKIRFVAADVLAHLALREDSGAAERAQRLSEISDELDRDEKDVFILDIFIQSVRELIELNFATVFRSSNFTTLSDDGSQPVDEFEPIVSLFMGNLPGSPAMAQDVPADGIRWNPLARLNLTNRQAIQSALAGALSIVAGRALSPTRYYWAVIAAFVMFTGTATRTETVLKGLNRVVGTLVGLFASIWLAEWTTGHTFWVLFTVVFCIFFGFYLMRLSYSYMIFFITIMIGQLYGVLHVFSPGLLVLRLGETAIGATIGFIVAVLVIPLSTQDTVKVARDNLLNDFALFLNSAADKIAGEHADAVDLDALSLTLDNRLRQLALVARPLTRPFIWGYSPRVRHRLVLYGSLIAGARALAVTLRDERVEHNPRIAASLRELAESAEGYVNGSSASEAQASHLAWRTQFDPGSKSVMADPVVRRLLHLRSLIHELHVNGATPV